MQLTINPLVAALLVSPAAAKPFNIWPRPSSTALSLHKRGLPGAVYVCNDNNFRGDCQWIRPDSQCHIPGTGADAPKSIGPDPGGFCLIYESSDCEGNQILSIRFPGLSNQIPQFGGLKCFVDGTTPKAEFAQGWKGPTSSAGAESSDLQLAGGVGSAARKEVREQLEAMEKDGFSQGMIGLKKGVYY